MSGMLQSYGGKKCHQNELLTPLSKWLIHRVIFFTFFYKPSVFRGEVC